MGLGSSSLPIAENETGFTTIAHVHSPLGHLVVELTLSQKNQ